MVEKPISKTSVNGMVAQFQKERRQFDSKARDIHARAAEMLKDGQENMSKGIASLERETRAKARDIHARAAEMTAEGEKKMNAGIKAVQEGIKEQVRENNAAAKEIGKGVKAIESKIEKMKEHIRGHERETTRYIHAFYHGE